MATGRGNKIVGQAGEYLVAAELSRRGLIATTFTGNVPHYDIIASDESGKHVSVQVKASSGPSWQFGSIAAYCDVQFDGERQVIGKMKDCPVKRLVMVFVRIGDYGEDRFYVMTWEKFRDLLVERHAGFLEKHNGRRPKRWESLHCAISETCFTPFRDKWEIVSKNLR